MKIKYNKFISQIFILIFGSILLFSLSADFTNAIAGCGRSGTCGDCFCDPGLGEDPCTCEDDCGVCSVSEPSSGGSINVEMDLPDELNEFNFGGGGNCLINAREIGGISNDGTCSTNGNVGLVLS